MILALFLRMGFPFFDAAGVMSQPVEDGVGKGGVADGVVPIGDGYLRGDGGGGLGEPENADAGPDPLLGMAGRAHDGQGQQAGMGAEACCFLDDAAVGPVLEASMLARHVSLTVFFGGGDMSTDRRSSCMGSNSASFVQDLDGAGGDADIDGLA